MLQFNAAMSNLRLEELKLIGNKFTWTNKQVSPLLEGWTGSLPLFLGWLITLEQLYQHCLEMFQTIVHALSP
jgi:hypothetical protein